MAENRVQVFQSEPWYSSSLSLIGDWWMGKLREDTYEEMLSWVTMGQL